MSLNSLDKANNHKATIILKTSSLELCVDTNTLPFLSRTMTKIQLSVAQKL